VSAVPRIGTYSHTGLIVTDLDAAMAVYGDMFGYSWGGPFDSDSPLATCRGLLPRRTRVVISREKPRLELIEIIDATAYDTLPGQRHRPNHVAYAVQDVGLAVTTLEKAGFIRDLAGRDEIGDTFAYMFDPNAGLHVEILAARIEALIAQRVEN